MTKNYCQSRHPLVSVLILSWNSSLHLTHCLDCLSKQTFRDFEVIVVDNGSNDGSVEMLRGGWDGLDLRFELLNMNRGFAAANNIGASMASGKWLALLNSDAFPQPDWLAKLVRMTDETNERISFASCQIQANNPELLDGAGDAYHISGLAWRRQYNSPVKNHGNEPKEVFSPCPAAAMYLREEFLEAGGFDEDYFSYFEDVDLGFRLRLLGGKCLYIPDAIVHHIGSASTGRRSDFSVYYGYRNMIWTFIKDVPSPLLEIFFPLHIITLLFFIVYLTLRGQGSAVFRAIFDALQGLPGTIKKRKITQKNKRTEWTKILPVMSKGFLEPYFELARRNRADQNK